MIETPGKLYGGVQDLRIRYKVDLCWHSLGKPLEERFPGLFWTRGAVVHEAQVALASNPVTRNKVAKGISQHELGEALDADAKRALMVKAYVWAHAHLPWWQLIIYFRSPEPLDGIGESFHISMLSEFSQIKRKALYQVNNTWHNFDGTFQNLPLHA